jgi:hypothetical protein
VPVVADPEAVSFIATHGGRLYVYADASGRKHVETKAPENLSLRFESVKADGFLMHVQVGIEHPDAWRVKLRQVPHHRLEVLWDDHPEHRQVKRALCVVGRPA